MGCLSRSLLQHNSGPEPALSTSLIKKENLKPPLKCGEGVCPPSGPRMEAGSTVEELDNWLPVYFWRLFEPPVTLDRVTKYYKLFQVWWCLTIMGSEVREGTLNSIPDVTDSQCRETNTAEIWSLVFIKLRDLRDLGILVPKNYNKSMRTQDYLKFQLLNF